MSLIWLDDANPLFLGSLDETILSFAILAALVGRVLDEIDWAVLFVLPLVAKRTPTPRAGYALEVRGDDDDIHAASLEVVASGYAPENNRSFYVHLGPVDDLSDVLEQSIAVGNTSRSGYIDQSVSPSKLASDTGADVLVVSISKIPMRGLFEL